MNYVALLKFRSTLEPEQRDTAMARRAGWDYPPGVTCIAEYWPLQTDLQVVSILSADDYTQVMAILFEWNDAFEITVYPAISVERGLAEGPGIMANVARMQG